MSNGLTREEKADLERWLKNQERLADIAMDRQIARSAVYSR